jgi:hypothetical protein
LNALRFVEDDEIGRQFVHVAHVLLGRTSFVSSRFGLALVMEGSSVSQEEGPSRYRPNRTHVRCAAI